MLSPSAAPRMKIATRVLRFLPPAVAARASHPGATPIPAITIAEPRRKTRRVTMILLPPLKLGRTENHRSDERRLGVLVLNGLIDRRRSLRGHIMPQYLTPDGRRIFAAKAGKDRFHAWN